MVSETYGRMLVIASGVIGYGLPWMTRLPGLLISLLGPLTGFAATLALGVLLACHLLFLMVRAVPRLFAPPLVHWRSGVVTVLNLTAVQEEHGPRNHPVP